MKKILIAAMAVSLAAATQVGALTVNVSTISGYNAGQGGGEFNVTPVTGTGYSPSVLVGNGFETFCLNRNLGIVVPGTYNATVNPNSVYDLQGGGSKTISLGTAWLYQQFATGVLANYRYSDTAGGIASLRALDGYNLQLAIWTLEGQYSYGGGAIDLAANAFIALAANNFGGGLVGLAAALANNSAGGFGVGALNLTYVAGNPSGVPIGTPAQPLLTLLPDGGTTLMLMGIGFSGLALISRKLRA